MTTSDTTSIGNKVNAYGAKSATAGIATQLDKAFKVCGDFPFSREYVRGLLANGQVSLKEMEQLQNKHLGPDGLYALLVYSLARKTIKKGLISAHYLPYLKTMANQILNGRLHCKRSNASFAGASVDAIFDIQNNSLLFDPEQIKIINNETLFESTIIHELWHSWQIFNKRSLPYSLFEVEAHFVQADYLNHTKPGILQEKYWLKADIDRQQGILKFTFMPPKETVIKAASLPIESPEYKAIMNGARNDYLLARAVVDAKSMTIIQRLVSQIPDGAPIEAVCRGLMSLIERTEIKLLQYPITTHLHCNKPKVASGTYFGSCSPDQDLIDYCSGVWALSIYLSQNNKIDDMTKYANGYFITAFKGQDLTGNPDLDFEVTAPLNK